MRLFRKIALSVLSVWLLGFATLAAELRLTVPPEGAVMPLLHPIHKAFLTMPRAERVEYSGNAEKRKELHSAGRHPLPVTLAWDALDLPEAQFTVWLSTTSDFASVRKLAASEPSVEANNLMINQPYYWKVVATSGDQSVTSAVRTFRTEDRAPRLLRIDGLPNVRDLGGRKAMGGRRVKQGMAYRTAGLNKNATTVYYTLDDLRDTPELADTYRKLVRENEAVLRTIEAQRERLRDVGAAKQIPYSPGSKWIVFRPRADQFSLLEYAAQASALRAIPKSFMGAKPEEAVLDEAGRFRFSTFRHHAPAVFMQEFEAPEDGMMQIGCGADWYWELRVNGEKLYDRLAGNEARPIGKDNFRLLVPVRRGHNLMVALVRSGSEGWVWFCGPIPPAPREAILADMIQSLERIQGDLLKLKKGVEPGKLKMGPAMVDYLLNDLGIKTDIDLRSNEECYGMTGSPLGESVTWFHYPGVFYESLLKPGGKKLFANVFRVFLNPTNYPIVFHCSAGMDRTGGVAFILNGLLGVEEEELYLDWEATNFWNAGFSFVRWSWFHKFVDGIRELPGQTLREKIEHYVLDAGFMPEDIEQYRHLMLE